MTLPCGDTPLNRNLRRVQLSYTYLRHLSIRKKETGLFPVSFQSKFHRIQQFPVVSGFHLWERLHQTDGDLGAAACQFRILFLQFFYTSLLLFGGCSNPFPKFRRSLQPFLPTCWTPPASFSFPPGTPAYP